MRVFVSSSCYDLIDLRAEVEAHLRDIGLRPILSDRPSSDFSEFAEQNSIAACLANVASAEVFVCILSQRYGPSLKEAGFDDFSATHMELREARRLKKPIYMYVRDRFLADYQIWKKDVDASLSWVKERKDQRLFVLFGEHEKLCPDNPNWFWVFRDSVELRAILSQHLESYSGRELLARWSREGRLPVIRVSGDGRRVVDLKTTALTVRVALKNADAQVLGVILRGPGIAEIAVGDLDSRAAFTREVVISTESLPVQHDLILEYTTMFGATIREELVLRYQGGNTFGTVEVRRKTLVRQLPEEIG